MHYTCDYCLSRICISFSNFTANTCLNIYINYSPSINAILLYTIVNVTETTVKMKQFLIQIIEILNQLVSKQI